jgi:Sulfatase-modifying factor enzyme 1
MEAPPPPARRRESPTPSILRLSLVVYAAVILTTVLAVAAWLWMRKAGEVPIEPSPHLPGGAMVSSMVLIPGDATIKPFYIDATEVTNTDFCAIIHCTGVTLIPDRPAVDVTIAQARQYASYKGKRLPTASEWERAARGATFPYRRASNVWELVENPGAPTAEALAIFADILQPARAFHEHDSAPDVGFRCAKDP